MRLGWPIGQAHPGQSELALGRRCHDGPCFSKNRERWQPVAQVDRKAFSAAAKTEKEELKNLQAHELGALRLKKWAIRMAVHHFKELALRGALEVLPSALLTEVLREVAVGYD
eukprot:s3302_g1.t1